MGLKSPSASDFDHGDLSGLTDNDHTQYVNAVSDTATVNLTLTGQSISADVIAGGTDHGGLGGLADDDHTQYVLHTEVDDTPVDGVTTDPISSNWAFDHEAAADPHTGYRLESADHSHQSTGLQAGQLDHGAALTGLTDDDHTQYLLVAGSRAMTGDLDMGGNDVFNVRNYYPDPGGRLTLTSATPVLVADAADQTTLYYALYKHDLVPLYDGTNWDVFRFTELSIAMAASANWAANSNFDVYVYNDGGTLRLVTGAAWTSDTARNESLTRLNGRWTNTASMTGRYAAASTVTVGANQGLYVGTIRTTASAGTTTMEFGGEALNGDPIRFYVWNAYNRVLTGGVVADTTDTWTYQSTTVRSKNNSTTNRATFVRGLNEDAMTVDAIVRGATSTAADAGIVGIGLDVTNSLNTSARIRSTASVSTIFILIVSYRGYPGLGLHFLQALEACAAAVAAVTFNGDVGVADILTPMAIAGMF